MRDWRGPARFKDGDRVKLICMNFGTVGIAEVLTWPTGEIIVSDTGTLVEGHMQSAKRINIAPHYDFEPRRVGIGMGGTREVAENSVFEGKMKKTWVFVDKMRVLGYKSGIN